MKIISKFKDYYDFAVGYDTDPRKVYVREKTLLSKEGNPWDSGLGRVASGLDRLTGRRKNLYLGCVAFCDFLYPYLLDLETETYYYYFEEIPKKIVEDFDEGERYYFRRDLYSFMMLERIRTKTETKYVPLNNSCDYNTLAETPILFTYMKEDGGVDFVMNGRLADVKFGSIKSPQEAYQELYNWIEFTEPETDSSPTNMSRFESKGFDKKTSFRNIK